MSETYTTLTAAEVTGALAPAEKAAFDNIQGGTSTLADIVARVPDQIRKAYSDGGREVSSVTGEFPAGDKERAIAIARWKLLISFPQMRAFQTAERKLAADDAMSWFDKVSLGELKGQNAVEVSTSSTRRFTRTKMEGL